MAEQKEGIDYGSIQKQFLEQFRSGKSLLGKGGHLHLYSSNF